MDKVWPVSKWTSQVEGIFSFRLSKFRMILLAFVACVAF